MLNLGLSFGSLYAELFFVTVINIYVKLIIAMATNRRLACVANVSVWFRGKERPTLVRCSLLRNCRKTLATVRLIGGLHLSSLIKGNHFIKFINQTQQLKLT